MARSHRFTDPFHTGSPKTWCSGLCTGSTYDLEPLRLLPTRTVGVFDLPTGAWDGRDVSSGGAAGTGSSPPARGGVLPTPGGAFASATGTMADKVAPEPSVAEQGNGEGGEGAETAESRAQRGSIVMMPSEETLARLDKQVSVGVRSSGVGRMAEQRF